MALDRIRKEADNCDSLEGFFMLHSVGGGSGSGLGSLLLERLSVDYGRKPKFSGTVYPSMPSHYGGVLEPYNAVLSTHCLLEHTDLCILFDNETLYRSSSKQLGV